MPERFHQRIERRAQIRRGIAALALAVSACSESIPQEFVVTEKIYEPQETDIGISIGADGNIKVSTSTDDPDFVVILRQCPIEAKVLEDCRITRLEVSPDDYERVDIGNSVTFNRTDIISVDRR